MDSTLMRASASMDSLTKREEMVRPPLSIAEYLQRLGQEADGAEEHGSPDPGEDEGPTPPSKPVPPNQKLLRRTDPEATLVDWPDFGRHLAYKAHLSVAGRQGQVITAAEPPRCSRGRG